MIDPMGNQPTVETEPKLADVSEFWDGSLTAAMNRLFRANVKTCMFAGECVSEERSLVDDGQIVTYTTEVSCSLGDDPSRDRNVYRFELFAEEEVVDEDLFRALFEAAEADIETSTDEGLSAEDLVLRREKAYFFEAQGSFVTFEAGKDVLGLYDIFTGELVYDEDALDEAPDTESIEDWDEAESEAFRLLTDVGKQPFSEEVEEQIIGILRQLNLLD